METSVPKESSLEENQVCSLYELLLESWNSYHAENFSNLFKSDGNIIGFDGRQVDGRQRIREHLLSIFENHQPASFIGIIREVRALCSTVFILRAVAGMVFPGESDINPELNVVQTMIATKDQDDFKIELFQNTPAAFHGRPDLVEQLNLDLREALQELKAFYR